MPARDRLTALDSAFLHLEAGGAHMHVASILAFRVRPSLVTTLLSVRDPLPFHVRCVSVPASPLTVAERVACTHVVAFVPVRVPASAH